MNANADDLGMSRSTTAFRGEIAGLRAIAVGAVVLFHLQVKAVAGGFIGVDVFFVISGYLITLHILSDLQSSRFSLSGFYARRIRRIFPALIATVALTYLAGALWCSPVMLLDLAKECTQALLSIANIQYWRESHAYFARASSELALLHCWSLSLEEQFYLIWPLYIALAYRAGNVWAAIAIASVASLAAAAWWTPTDSSAVFFLTPFRIYEFGIGALTILFERVRTGPRWRELLSAAGIIAIVASAAALRSDTANLGLAVLAPCLGAAGVIAGGGKTAGGRLLRHPAAIGLGAISYSVYLCHWPMIYFAEFIFGEAAGSALGSVVMLLAVLITGSIMYLLVERPFLRSPVHRDAGYLRTSLQFSVVLFPLAALTHATYLNAGFEWRIPEAQRAFARQQALPFVGLAHVADGPAAFQLAGDSHAAQYEAGLAAIQAALGINGEILADAGCPLLYGVALRDYHERQRCIDSRDRMVRQIEHASLPIIFVQNWPIYDDAAIELESVPDTAGSEGSYGKLTRALTATMERFVLAGKQILLIGAQVNAECAFNRARLLQGPLPHAPLSPCPPGLRREIRHPIQCDARPDTGTMARQYRAAAAGGLSLRCRVPDNGWKLLALFRPDALHPARLPFHGPPHGEAAG